MTALEKRTLRPVEIYDIRYDRNGYPTFLYYQNGQWLQKSAKYFVPAGAGEKSEKIDYGPDGVWEKWYGIPTR